MSPTDQEMQVDEGALVEGIESKAAHEADRMSEKYRDQFDAFGSSMLAKVRGGSPSAYDYYALGQQLERFEDCMQIWEEDSNLNLLGKIPNVALDVITAVQGVSILPIIASVQPIDEERGLVYFRNIRGVDTKGNITAGDTITDPRTIDKTPEDYADSLVEGEQNATVAATFNYTYVVARKPIRSQTLKVYLDGTPTIEAEDIGPAKGGDPNIGRLWGKGLSGTINYTTGQVDYDFTVDPGNDNVTFSYQENYELTSDLPQIDTFLDTCPVRAKVYALKGTVSMLHSFAARKRFGMSLEDDLATDLTTTINKEIGGELIKKLRASAPVSGVTFNTALPAGVSEWEHNQAIKIRMADVEAALTGQMGRGTISVLVAGRNIAAKLSTIPGWEKLSDGTTLGPHVFGTIDGVTVVRVHDTNLLGANQSVAMWKGTSPFDAPCSYSPYMPLAVTGVIPLSPNPLTNQRAAAVWAAIEGLVPNYSTTFDFV